MTTPTVIIVLLVLALIVAIWLLVRTFRSISELRWAANRLAQGDLSRRIRLGGPAPVRVLADALNQMASQLQDRLATVVRQRNELGAVLSSMIEGVLAVDTEERIISLNAAAARLLDLAPTAVIGRPIQEVVRNTALQRFAADTLSQQVALQADMTLRVPRPDGVPVERYLQAQSAILRDDRGQRLGAVLVLHDVTQLRRLESVRRDFVANVSHEVKTPLSAIKAAVETLLDEAGEVGEADPDHHDHRFLQIIARQAQRMDNIVEDLLALARIEQEQGRVLAELKAEPVNGVLKSAAETCQAKAAEKDIELTVDCEPDLLAAMNPMLLEQAVTNLIDNAIKYSPPQTRVEVTGHRDGEEVVIGVVDEGRGIEPEHLPRIFERFYRTDRARSRALGGTGLGLSIVKHVAEAHGGRVAVDSFPGTGSHFRIYVRAADAQHPARRAG